ncbi:hypothetical protein POV99_07530 [Enterobacter kobei]|uniref:hypothetical protein n=1 Tax=Enterobacter kobei TaxID=208224 RepID=UPI002FF9ED73
MKPSYEELEQKLAESQREFRAADATIENMQMQVEKLAAENAESEKRMQQLIQVINNTDNDYCMCGNAMKNHAHGGCGHPTGMFDYHYNQWLESGNKTSATDSFLAEVRAQIAEEALKIMGNFTSDECGDSVYIAVKEFAESLRKGVQS